MFLLSSRILFDKKIFSGTFQAVCCKDEKHCCPHGKTCDLSTSTCKGGDVETDWMAKEPAIPVGVVTEQKAFSVFEEASKNGGESGEQLIQLVSKAPSSRVKNVPCGGGRSCPDFYLCCPGGQRCCPLTSVIFHFIHSMHVCVRFQSIGTSQNVQRQWDHWVKLYLCRSCLINLHVNQVFQIIRRCFA